MKIRDHLTTDLCVVQARVHNWLDRYFPEFLTVFKDWECKSAIQMLSLNLLPHELISISDETLLQHLREAAKRGLGLGRIKKLKEAAICSVGIQQGSELAKMELKLLLSQYEWLQNKLEDLGAKLDELLLQIPHVQQVLAMKGIGRDTIAGFLAEVGDIRKYRHPKQITKLAGLNLKTNSSGTHTGQTRITKRGRKRLRALLFRVMMPLVVRTKILPGSISDLHLMDRLNEGMWERRLCEMWEGSRHEFMWRSKGATIHYHIIHFFKRVV